MWQDMSEKIYKCDSNDYAKHSSAQYTWAQELIDKLYLKGTESVLDIGCGDGKFRTPDLCMYFQGVMKARS